MNQSGFITFVREGSNPPRSSMKSQRNIDYVLTGSSDWKLLVDYDDAQIVFPTIICATDDRPDVVIWSKESKRVIIIELTARLVHKMQRPLTVFPIYVDCLE